MDVTTLSKPERDAAICRAYGIGYGNADIGRAFGLSRERIRQILMKHEVSPRSPCLLTLLWDSEPMIFPPEESQP